MKSDEKPKRTTINVSTTAELVARYDKLYPRFGHTSRSAAVVAALEEQTFRWLEILEMERVNLESCIGDRESEEAEG